MKAITLTVESEQSIAFHKGNYINRDTSSANNESVFIVLANSVRWEQIYIYTYIWKVCVYLFATASILNSLSDRKIDYTFRVC